MGAFIVKLRNTKTRMWEDETEVVAETAHEAAEKVAGTALTAGAGQRAHLRARVWPTPFGTQPDIHFYVPASIPET